MRSKHREQSSPFRVIVLAMNRPEALFKLLSSIEGTDFLEDEVVLEVHFDFHEQQTDALRVAESFEFSKGLKRIQRSQRRLGLAHAWYHAWFPSSRSEKAIILEDDIVLSNGWYSWLKGAWDEYDGQDDVAGISLMRQVLVPKIPSRQTEIVNAHLPFKYSLVGSIAFSPAPLVWREFLHWRQLLEPRFNVTTPGLVTSEWWNRLDKTHMWTQHFIYFCLFRDLYTIYVNLPDKKTLAAHLRAKGEHYPTDQGQDFELGNVEHPTYPPTLLHYGWDGKERAREPSRSGLDILSATFAITVGRTLDRAEQFFMIFIDERHSLSIHGILDTLPTAVIILCNNFSAARKIMRTRPDKQVFTTDSQGLKNWNPGVLHRVVCTRDRDIREIVELREKCKVIAV